MAAVLLLWNSNMAAVTCVKTFYKTFTNSTVLLCTNIFSTIITIIINRLRSEDNLRGTRMFTLCKKLRCVKLSKLYLFLLTIFLLALVKSFSPNLIKSIWLTYAQHIMTCKKAKNLTYNLRTYTTALPSVTLWLNYVLLWLQINLQKR